MPRLIIISFFSILTIVFSCQHLHSVIKRNKVFKNGVDTDAEIVAIKKAVDSYDDVIRIKYEADGVNYVKRFKQSSKSFKPGDKLKVRYEEGNPNNFLTQYETKDYFLVKDILVALGIGVFIALVVGFIIKNK